MSFNVDTNLLSTMLENEMDDRPVESDYYDKESNTVYKVVLVDFSSIDPSEYNNSGRSLVDDNLNILADSIRDYGLKDPIRVYPNSIHGYKYTILSGHRRYAAIDLLNKNGDVKINKVPCIICDVPNDKIDEYIDVAQSNITRKSPDDLKKEILVASEVWEEIKELNKSEEYTPKLEAAFVARYKDNEAYKEDPALFRRNNYRAKLEFIRSITGLDLSNKTISTYLTKTLASSDEDALPKRVPKKTAEMTPEKLAKKFEQTKKCVMKCYDQDPDIAEKICDLIDAIIMTIK